MKKHTKHPKLALTAHKVRELAIVSDDRLRDAAAGENVKSGQMCVKAFSRQLPI